MEFIETYLVLEGYSARVIREWYTHIGGSPTRLQESTRYVDFCNGFDYVTPKTIKANAEANKIYSNCMEFIVEQLRRLKALEIPNEDLAMLLPIGMNTKITCMHNARNLMDMSRQRECTRAYWEYRELFNDIKKELSNYSEEWKILINDFFGPKCKFLKYCPEKKSCGKVNYYLTLEKK